MAMELMKPEFEQMAAPNAMQLLQTAVMQGASIDTIERLAKLQKEMREFDAKLAFDKGMQRAQGDMKRVGADAVNPQTRSKYATYAKLDSALRPIYSKEGFAVSFNTADCPLPDHMRLLAYVSHQDGYTREYQIDMPADGKGAKGGDVMTKTHAMGAAASYGQRYLLKMIFNVAVGETDDDGNAGGTMSEPSLVSWLDTIANAENGADLKKFYMAAYKEAQAAKDRMAMDAIMGAKEVRKGELSL